MTNYRTWLPGERIEVLFMFQAGTVWASMESVYNSCIKDNRFNVKLILISETTVEKSHMVGAKQFLDENRLSYELYEDVDFNTYNPHLVFIQFPYDAAFHTPETLSIQFKRKGIRVVYIPYGIEISDTEIARKDHFSSFVVENCWRLYTSCEGLKKEYSKYCRNRRAVRVTGSPKFDGVYHKNSFPLKNEINKKANGRKIIVWKMHFPKKIKENGKIYQITPYIAEYIKFAKNLDKYQDLFFVVMAHPKMLKGVVSSDVQGDDSLMQQVKDLFDTIKLNSNVYIDADDDYRYSFYHADAIIMDRSAVMIEAAMLNIPVLLMKNEEYSEAMTIPVEDVKKCFCQGTTCEDMNNFIYDYRTGKDNMASERLDVIQNVFPFLDGKCGERILEDIVSSLNDEHRKPRVIIYGTGEISHYYMEKQKWAVDNRFEIIAVADSDLKKWNTDYYGSIIIAPDQIVNYDFDAIVIMTEPHYYEIKKSLVYDYYLDERKIWRLDEFVVQLDLMEN